MSAMISARCLADSPAAVAFMLAILSDAFAAIARALMTMALVTQTMPQVGLTPLLVLLLGRGYLDHGMIWTVAAIAALISILFYHFV
jgi:ABC-type nitrate/sulfonate/bicarbonate transport system permease component